MSMVSRGSGKLQSVRSSNEPERRRAMKTPISVGQVLRAKGFGYSSIQSGSTAYEALELMAEKNIGALLVMEGDRLVGVFSERDYARKVILKGKSSKNTVVRDLMTSNPVTVSPDRTIAECMLLMTNNHIRHLPVLDGNLLLGVVSIGDIVHTIITSQESTIQELESYITEGY
jgi:signal-transduction protein with cAMP-binding, CBS, and nucleotidyltransferase domain